jgi:hypothetical protein
MARDEDLELMDDELMPAGASLDQGASGPEFDINNLRVDFSTEEASSEARDFSPMPTGKYVVNVTDVTVKTCGPKSKNPGKPFYALEMTVQDGAFKGRKVWTNVMLFPGALYTIAQIMKAMSQGVGTGSQKVPTPVELQGQTFLCAVSKVKDLWKMEQDGIDPSKPDEVIWKNEVRAFFKAEGSTTGSGAGDSLMP